MSMGDKKQRRIKDVHISKGLVRKWKDWSRGLKKLNE